MAMGAFAAEYLVIVQWTHLLLGRNANNPSPTNTQSILFSIDCLLSLEISLQILCNMPCFLNDYLCSSEAIRENPTA